MTPFCFHGHPDHGIFRPTYWGVNIKWLKMYVMTFTILAWTVQQDSFDQNLTSFSLSIKSVYPGKDRKLSMYCWNGTHLGSRMPSLISFPYFNAFLLILPVKVMMDHFLCMVDSARG